MGVEVEVKRGEIWWVNGGYAPGSTEMVGRPALAVSKPLFDSDVVVVYMTTAVKTNPMQPCIQYGGEKKWVLCNQVGTVRKELLTRKIAELSDQEMSKVSKALRIVLDLEEKKPTDEKKPTEDMVALRVECEMYKKLYNAAMDRLVDMRLEHDMSAAAPEPEPEPEPKPELEPKEKGPIDLNTCTVDELKELGFWHRQAVDIIEARPFGSVEELADVSDIPPWLYASVKNRVMVAPIPESEPEPEPEPEVREDGFLVYDLNTVSADDLYKRLGFKPAVAENIVAARPFKKVEDLAKVPGVTRLAYQLVSCRLTVNEPKVLDLPVKLNVNKVTPQELAAGLGISLHVAYKITGHRNKCGDYKSLEELLNARDIGPGFLAKHRDKLEV